MEPRTKRGRLKRYIKLLTIVLGSFYLGRLSGFHLGTTTSYKIADGDNAFRKASSGSSMTLVESEGSQLTNLDQDQQDLTWFDRIAAQQLRKTIRSLFPQENMDPVLVSTASTIVTSLLHFPPNASKNNSGISPNHVIIKPQRKCAVVGNSGILLKSGCGELIDKNDMVIRSNIATIKGFQHDVGNKRDIVTINRVVLKWLVEALNKTKEHPNQMRNLRQYNNSILWFQLDLTNEVKPLLITLAECCKKAHISVYFAFSTISIRTVSKRLWNIPEHLPSAGLMITTAALTFCDELSLFGFYPFSTDQNDRAIKYHYFDKNIMNYTTSRHKLPAEFSILQRLHDLKIINLRTERCDVS
ncbi:alpha-2,8-sialyltransferase 8B-like [Amphiura filiformis]|uniref:alpha-2,8-sialyltransferase 8B-like n=1 Tax=Amphiura filiformis TaxID=82378 RepID=UPI003B227910